MVHFSSSAAPFVWLTVQETLQVHLQVLKDFQTLSLHGKFGLRSLAQSLARELHPKNIHIAHFVIDGGIASKERPNGGKKAFSNLMK